MAFIIAMLAQLTGVNAIIFYSAQLFTPDSSESGNVISPNVGSAILLSWNAISAVIGMVAANFFGRKRLMLVTNGFITLTLTVMWYFMWKQLEVPALVATAFFLLMFELGVGSILWPYAAEICTVKGTALATVNTWFWTMVVGLFTP